MALPSRPSNTSPECRAPAAPGRDSRLVRRLDWRFLLPEPRLGRVVYLGPGDDGLVAALRESSESCTVLPLHADVHSPGGGVEGLFDLAVVQAPRRSTFRRLRSLLVEGGSLYCELGRASWFGAAWSVVRNRARSGWETPRGSQHLLRELGFQDVQTYWHHPDFERCQRIVPLGASVAVEHFFDGGRTLSRLSRRVGRYAVSSGLLSRFLPSVSVVACGARDMEARR